MSDQKISPAVTGYNKAKCHLLDSIGERQTDQAEQLGVTQAMISQMRGARKSLPRSLMERVALLFVAELDDDALKEMWPAVRRKMRRLKTLDEKFNEDV